MKKVALFVCLIGNLAFAWPLSLPWVNGTGGATTYQSSDHPGSVFVVEAFFNGCHWCHVNAPKVGKLASHFKDNPHVQVLDVGTDGDDSEYEAWIQSTHPNHPVLRDDYGQTFLTDFHIQGFPTTLVLDCRGEEVFRHVGSWTRGGDAEVSSAVERALASCTASFR